MRVGWNEKTIAWMEAASAFTGFHRKLAALLRPHLGLGGTLCDLGCGLGLIDLELSPWFERVTCLDTSGPALAALRRLAARRGCTNLELRQGDVEALDGEWDTVLGVFFGFGDRIPRWLAHCRRGLVVVVADGAESTFGSGRPSKRYTAGYAQMLLDQAGIPCPGVRPALPQPGGGGGVLPDLQRGRLGGGVPAPARQAERHRGSGLPLVSAPGEAVCHFFCSEEGGGAVKYGSV